LVEVEGGIITRDGGNWRRGGRYLTDEDNDFYFPSSFFGREARAREGGEVVTL
jgi:hypothetical protein